jgi:hypothetical protein
VLLAPLARGQRLALLAVNVASLDSLGFTRNVKLLGDPFSFGARPLRAHVAVCRRESRERS